MASLIYLIFQTENPAAAHRFRQHLSRKGWMRLSNGVYQTIKHFDFDREKFWSEVLNKFGFHLDRDFFAMFETDDLYIPTAKYYNKKAPPWPSPYPEIPEETE